MTTVDRAIQALALAPADDPALRAAAVDALRAAGEPDLALAVESDLTGPDLVAAGRRLAKQTGLPLGVKLLWCAYHVVSRIYPMAAVGPLAPAAAPGVRPAAAVDSRPAAAAETPRCRLLATAIEGDDVSFNEYLLRLRDDPPGRHGRR